MSEQRKNLKGYVKSVISQRLFGREGIKEYGEAVKQLGEKGHQIDETAVVFVAIFEGKERYRESLKGLNNILDAERLFNQRAIERNPEIAKEMAEAYEHLKKFNEVIARRRKRIAMSRNKQQNSNLEQKSFNDSATNERGASTEQNADSKISSDENIVNVEIPSNQEEF